MPRQMTEAEITKKRELADALYQSRKMLELDLENALQNAKRLRHLLKENNRDFDSVQDQILSGKHEPEQGALLDE